MQRSSTRFAAGLSRLFAGKQNGSKSNQQQRQLVVLGGAGIAALFAANAMSPFSSNMVHCEPPMPKEYYKPPADPKKQQAAEQDFFVNEIPKDLDLQQCDVTLYQFESCPFCRKARVTLDYHKIPYKVVEVHPLTKKELKGWSDDYKKVPILVIKPKQTSAAALPPGAEQTHAEFAPVILKDSKRIVHSIMENRGTRDAKQQELERRWIKWSDEVLVQLVVMNIYRTWKESSETFDYLLTHPKFNFAEKWAAHLMGTGVMLGVSMQRKKKYNVTDERKAIYDAVNEFADAVAQGGGKFLGGATPNEADFAVYGILRSMEGFATERDMFANSRIGTWYGNMQSAIGKSAALNTVARGPSSQ